jgi:hypothetical protein
MRKGSEMKPLTASILMAAVAMAACSPSGPKGVDTDVLAEAVGEAVGDPGTCVVLAERGSGKIVWRSAKSYVCGRTLPSCVAPTETSVEALAKRTAKGGALMTGCSNVSWSAGPTRREDIVFAAVMQGERALPGIEIARRLDKAFERAGL